MENETDSRKRLGRELKQYFNSQRSSRNEKSRTAVATSKLEISSNAAWREQINVAGLKDYYSLRKVWSWFLLSCISGLLLFQIMLTVVIGIGWLKYVGYKTILGIVIGESFAQVLALAFVVVKFLFDGKRREY